MSDYILWGSNNTDPNNQHLSYTTSYTNVIINGNNMDSFYSKDDIKYILKKCVRKGEINEALLVMLTGSKDKKRANLANLVLKIINE